MHSGISQRVVNIVNQLRKLDLNHVEFDALAETITQRNCQQQFQARKFDLNVCDITIRTKADPGPGGFAIGSDIKILFDGEKPRQAWTKAEVIIAGYDKAVEVNLTLVPLNPAGAIAEGIVPEVEDQKPPVVSPATEKPEQKPLEINREAFMRP